MPDGSFTADAVIKKTVWPESGTVVVRPESDFDKSGTITFSSGTTGWNLVDEAVYSASDYYICGTNARLAHEYSASDLSAEKVITQVVFSASYTNQAPAGTAGWYVQNPDTLSTYGLAFPGQNNSANPLNVTHTVRPWDSQPYTVADIDAIRTRQVGGGTIGNFRVRQLYITASWVIPIYIKADAVIQGQRTGSLTANAIIKKKSTVTFTADAMVKLTRSSSFTADAVISNVSTVISSITADAVVTGGLSGSFTADAMVKLSQSGSLLANAVLKRHTQPTPINVDAVIKKTIGVSSYPSVQVLGVAWEGQAAFPSTKSLTIPIGTTSIILLGQHNLTYHIPASDTLGGLSPDYAHEITAEAPSDQWTAVWIWNDISGRSNDNLVFSSSYGSLQHGVALALRAVDPASLTIVDSSYSTTGYFNPLTTTLDPGALSGCTAFISGQADMGGDVASITKTNAEEIEVYHGGDATLMYAAGYIENVTNRITVGYESSGGAKRTVAALLLHSGPPDGVINGEFATDLSYWNVADPTASTRQTDDETYLQTQGDGTGEKTVYQDFIAGTGIHAIEAELWADEADTALLEVEWYSGNTLLGTTGDITNGSGVSAWVAGLIEVIPPPTTNRGRVKLKVPAASNKKAKWRRVKVRRGMVFRAVIRKPRTATLTASATLQATHTGSFTADAVIAGDFTTVTGSLTASAVVRRTQSYAFQVDAVSKRQGSGQFTADGVMRRSQGGSLQSDAVISRTASGQYLVDAVIYAVRSQDLTADAVVRAVGLGSIHADAFLVAVRTGALGVDAVILAGAVGGLTADAVVGRAQSGGVTADAVVGASFSGSFTADAQIVERTIGSLTADAVVQRIHTYSFPSDAVLGRPATGSLSADAYVVRAVVATFTADARIWSGSTFTADAVLLTHTSGSLSADATIKKVSDASVTADAVTKKTASGSITANAVIAGTRTAGFVASAVLRSTATGSFSADAALRRTSVGALPADAVVFGARSGSFSAFAVIQQTFARSFTASAWIKAYTPYALGIIPEPSGFLGISSDTSGYLGIANETTGYLGIERVTPSRGSFTADAVVTSRPVGSFTADAVIV
jgi:hypothetical protein